MYKLFDFNDLVIRKLNNKECNIIEVSLPHGFISKTYVNYNQEVQELIIQAINTIVNSNKPMYIQCFADEKELDRKDIEDIYDIVETCIVNALIDRNNKKEREQRLGIYGINEKVKIKTSNLLSLINYKNKNEVFGFEVAKRGATWKKRMIK